MNKELNSKKMPRSQASFFARPEFHAYMLLNLSLKWTIIGWTIETPWNIQSYILEQPRCQTM